MKRRYQKFNPGRKIEKWEKIDFQHCSDISKKICYGGNPEHKKNPGDFGLTPPTNPRPGKSLCDDVGILSRQIALEHLQAGLLKGLTSESTRGGWPRNIWSVTEDGRPLEAQLENNVTGAYHGYPMPASDPLAAEVVKQWNIRLEEIKSMESRR